jgi:hypothetical protein
MSGGAILTPPASTVLANAKRETNNWPSHSAAIGARRIESVNPIPTRVAATHPTTASQKRFPSSVKEGSSDAPQARSADTTTTEAQTQ